MSRIMSQQIGIRPGSDVYSTYKRMSYKTWYAIMRVERHFGIGQVDEAAWRALEPPDFPFFDLEFLHALERSRSIGRGSGWSPVYLICGDGREVLGALPLYLKTDSYGEYVFDREWVHAYREHGLSCYTIDISYANQVESATDIV